MNYTGYFKIKDDWSLDNLLQLGFKRVDYSEGDIGYKWKNIQYEIKNYYEIEDDGSHYTDNFGRDYRSMISVDGTSRIIWIEVINNDCSYHNEGDEVNFIANIFYELTKLNAIERCDNNGTEKE